jgi:Lon protease-like protein
MEPLRRYRLPLFPLPVVLFPTATMPLHIFEPRYRRMVARCLDTDRRFGLVYHDFDAKGPFLTEIGTVGCVAEIVDFQPIPDGRSVLVALGIERFSIADGIESGEAYYEALVTPYGDVRPDEGIEAHRRRSLTLFEAVVRALPGEPGAIPELDVSTELSFPLVRTIDVDADWQQAFLELRDEAHRLERLDAVFRAALG